MAGDGPGLAAWSSHLRFGSCRPKSDAGASKQRTRKRSFVSPRQSLERRIQRLGIPASRRPSSSTGFLARNGTSCTAAIVFKVRGTARNRLSSARASAGLPLAAFGRDQDQPRHLGDPAVRGREFRDSEARLIDGFIETAGREQSCRDIRVNHRDIVRCDLQALGGQESVQRFCVSPLGHQDAAEVRMPGADAWPKRQKCRVSASASGQLPCARST